MRRGIIAFLCAGFAALIVADMCANLKGQPVGLVVAPSSVTQSQWIPPKHVETSTIVVPVRVIPYEEYVITAN